MPPGISLWVAIQLRLTPGVAALNLAAWLFGNRFPFLDEVVCSAPRQGLEGPRWVSRTARAHGRAAENAEI
jgi:hypothetical protein